MAKSNAQRKQDLEAALKQFARSKTATLSLDELANLYGLTKPAFVNLRKTVPGFPEPARREGNAYFYLARVSVKALLEYVTRNEKQTADRGRRFNALVAPVQEEDGESHLTMSAQEQLRAYDLRQKLTAEAILHGQLHRSDECSATTERVFSMISRLFGSPASTMDPNGQWPADVRMAVDDAGRTLVLRCYDELRQMLSPDVDKPVSGSSTARAGRAGPKPKGKAGKSGGSVGKKPRQSTAKRVDKHGGRRRS